MLDTPPDFLPLRPMTEEDVAGVMALEERAYPFPWTGGIFRDCIRQRYSCWVYEEDGEICGYAVVMFVLDEMHLLNICIAPEQQGRHLGSRLLRTLERVARGAKVTVCFLEVRVSNYAAIRLYLNAGFNEIGVRRGYYPMSIGREDALVMSKMLL